MSVDPVDRLELSDEGAQRRDDILAALRTRAQNRRRGRAAITVSSVALGCLALLAGAALMIHGSQSPSNHLSNHAPSLADSGHQPHPPTPTPTPTPAHLIPTPPTPTPEPTIRITIVTNGTLPSAPCADPRSADPSGAANASGASTPAVCLLSDAQLLRLLDRDGETYGLVRVGGRTTVVANSAPR